MVKKKMQQFLKKSPNASSQAALYHLDGFPGSPKPDELLPALELKAPENQRFQAQLRSMKFRRKSETA
jgi:hypothetical protein